MTITFKKAVKRALYLVLGIAGPSGSGKTYSALRLAAGLLGEPMTEENVALLDTEHKSASLYADEFNFAKLDMNKPYTPQKYEEAIKCAEAQGFKVMIIDSMTHAWAGIGGLLEMKDQVAKASKSGNTYTAWATVTPQHNALVEAVLSSKMHIIVSLRSKQAYAIIAGQGGAKSGVKKLGMEPIFREGFEYECSIFFELSIEGNLCSATKDRSKLFKDQIPFLITETTGKNIKGWLEKGGPSLPEERPTVIPPQPKPDPPASPAPSTNKTTESKPPPPASTDYKNNPPCPVCKTNTNTFRSKYITKETQLYDWYCAKFRGGCGKNWAPEPVKKPEAAKTEVARTSGDGVALGQMAEDHNNAKKDEAASKKTAVKFIDEMVEKNALERNFTFMKRSVSKADYPAKWTYEEVKKLADIINEYVQDNSDLQDPQC